MTDAEVLAKVQDAIAALRDYRSRRQQNTPRNERIEESTTTLLNEAYATGAAGRPCPQCGGSGRA